MGTNYYIREKECKHCGRYEEIHLGKSSGGWQFSFQYNAGKYYKNIEEMKKWLKDKQIWNEYDEKISYKEFWKMIEEKQKDKKNWNHADRYPDGCLLIAGYSFSDYDFC